MKIELNLVEYTPEGVLYRGQKVKNQSRLHIQIKRAEARDAAREGWLDLEKKGPMRVHHYKMEQHGARVDKTAKTAQTARSGRNANHESKLFQDPNG